MVVRLPPTLEIKTNFGLVPVEGLRRGFTALNNWNGPYAFTSMYFWSSETLVSTRLVVCPEMPAFAMTTSRGPMPYAFIVSMAVATEPAEAISSSTVNRLDPGALERVDKDWDLEGSRIVAITVVFGMDRYVATSPLPSPV